jgi:ElaB/YqjD/DUF883 family membrane-anchored ribosome-binding protein
MSTTREGQIAENVAHKLDEIAGSAHQLYDRGRERVGELRDSVDVYIKERPMRSVLIAAGVGLCLGLILARR